MEGYKEVRESVQLLGFNDHFRDINSMVFAVLLLGNIQFDDSTFGDETPCSIVDLGGIQGVLGKVS